MRLTAPQPLQDALQDPVTPDSTSSAAGPHTYRSPTGGERRRNLTESSDLVHLPGRGVQISALARDASFYRPGAARGWERGGRRGGRSGAGSRAALSAAPPAGPEKLRSCPGLARSCRDAHKGAHRMGAPGKGAAGRGVRGFLTPALGQSRRLRVPRETGGEHSASLGDA